MVEITSSKALEAWLNKQGRADFAQVIAARAALRVLPYAFGGRVDQEWVNDLALPLFRALSISWAARNFPDHHMANAAYDAHDAATAAGRFALNNVDAVANVAGLAAYTVVNDHLAAATAANAAHAAADAEDRYAELLIWDTISADCDWLIKASDNAEAARRLTWQPLWLSTSTINWPHQKDYATERLNALDKGYDIWIDWYDRRIMGERAAFAIPGDYDRTEDKKILARLADATNEDFWDKGATYVNTTLQSWIDEARARVAPKTIPLQEPDAIAYGLNGQGKLDRLPASDQMHLRDIPDQHRIYRDVREAALELQGEGQRLGARLERALGRFLTSIPENFADAECYSVWRDGNALRRIHLAHRAVAAGKDYDDKRLDPAMAEMLGDVLDRYNLFAFGDDGLRAKDEAAIPPQERTKAVDEAAKAAPLIEALLASPEVITEIVRDDLLADQADQALPEGDPYDDQALVQSNKSMRNRIAALLSGIGRQVKQSGKSVREGAERAVGALIVSEVAGVTTLHQPILAFAATHLTALKTYAGAAYSNSLQWLWYEISKLGDKF